MALSTGGNSSLVFNSKVEVFHGELFRRLFTENLAGKLFTEKLNFSGKPEKSVIVEAPSVVLQGEGDLPI